jgi:hypothetical protein
MAMNADIVNAIPTIWDMLYQRTITPPMER